MSFRIQFVKCTLCVILYIIVCSLLLRIKHRFYFTVRPDSPIFAHQSKDKYIVIQRAITKPTGFDISHLGHAEIRSDPINLQESISLLQQISNTCDKYNLRTPLRRRHFLYNFERNSMYCWIRKVASTSFTKLFSDMRHRQATHDYYREVDILAPQTLEELQHIVKDTKTFKLLVVRHPFHRLVSSYRDRIEDNSKHTAQAWIYTKKIFHLTRPALFHSNISTGNFQEKVFTHDKRLKLIPTFNEFVLWLLQSSEQDDVHWDSYYTHCSVCNIRYNYILKLDDYTNAQINYIFSRLGLDGKKTNLSRLEKTRGGYTNFATTCKYFRSLTREIIFKLYERYKVDFEMYNYDLNRYMHCTNKKN
ncbi:carbohydrate sulfotransferase 11 [Halictus rubicundus]|uniref:carbohydrate sulfotransferase 11 n=1 Tax=Halictus rubicundus TaxID=77578 RepID=UPI00403674FB